MIILKIASLYPLVRASLLLGPIMKSLVFLINIVMLRNKNKKHFQKSRLLLGLLVVSLTLSSTNENHFIAQSKKWLVQVTNSYNLRIYKRESCNHNKQQQETDAEEVDRHTFLIEVGGEGFGRTIDQSRGNEISERFFKSEWNRETINRELCRRRERERESGENKRELWDETKVLALLPSLQSHAATCVEGSAQKFLNEGLSQHIS